MKKIPQNRLQVTCDESCGACGGTGLRIHNKYSDICRTVTVTVDVCPCVKVVIARGQNQHTKAKAVTA